MESQLLLGYAADAVVIRVVTRGTMRESPAFRAAADIAVKGSPLVVDMSECEYLDSTFLGCLIGVQKQAENHPRGSMVIVADDGRQIKLFSTSSLDRYFDFIDACPPINSDLVPIEGTELELEELSRHVLDCHRRLAERGGADAEAFQRICDRLEGELEGRGSRS